MSDIKDVNKFELCLLEDREIIIKPDNYCPVKISWRDDRPYILTKDSEGEEIMIFLQERHKK